MSQIVVNYHITERCNFSCDFCFAKWDLGKRFTDELHQDQSSLKSMLKNVYDFFSSSGYSSVRLNIAGGEPFMLDSIYNVISTAKDIGFDVSVITNGSYLSSTMLEKTVPMINMLGLSLDSFSRVINIQSGRCSRSGAVITLEKAKEVFSVSKCVNKDIDLKINTVVHRLNFGETVSKEINQLMPSKWKIFQVLGDHDYAISSKEFNSYINRNSAGSCVPIIAENNDLMTHSYIMIDPLGRFFQNTDQFSGQYVYSRPINEVGASAAFKEVDFLLEKFNSRYIPLRINQGFG